MKDRCSFFSAARRTNQEAPPQLSGFSARRLGRRRGLRNSLRSNSPRPFSSVFLASSPPDKGGINQSFFRFYSTFFFNPSVLRTPPLYFALQNTGEEGEIQYFGSTVVLTPSPYGHSPYIPCRNTGGEDCKVVFFLCCFCAPQCCWARQRRVLRHSFIMSLPVG